MKIEYFERKKSLTGIRKGMVLMCHLDKVFNRENKKIIKHITNDNKKIDVVGNIYPEFGKDRPVVIIKVNKSNSSALIVPLTTLEPKDTTYSVKINKEELPGMLNKKDSWAIADHITLVSLRRITSPRQQNKRKGYILLKNTKLHTKLFEQIKLKIIEVCTK